MLTGTRRPVEQDTTRRSYAELLEQIRVEKRKRYHLLELVDV